MSRLISRFPRALAAILAPMGIVASGGCYDFVDPRPENTTAARVYAEGARAIDYCTKPVLDGSGLRANDIPKAYTPHCGVDRWPAPILKGCTEPLPPEAQDLRGLWRAVEGRVGHVERIEQCGNRVVVSNPRLIHDFRTTGTLIEGANDINPSSCRRIRAAIHWSDEKVLEFQPWNLMTLVTRRLEDEDTLVWEYPKSPTSRLERICRLPDLD